MRRHSLTIHWPNQVMLSGAPLLPSIGPVSVVSVCLTALRPAPMLLCTICPHGGTTNVVVYILPHCGATVPGSLELQCIDPAGVACKQIGLGHYRRIKSLLFWDVRAFVNCFAPLKSAF